MVSASLVLKGQDPVLQGSVVRTGTLDYQIEGQPLAAEEYVLTMPGGLQMRLLGEGDTLISFEVPVQAVEVVLGGLSRPAIQPLMIELGQTISAARISR